MNLRRRTPAPLPERRPAPISPHDALQIAIEEAAAHLRNAIEAYAIQGSPDLTIGQRLLSAESLMFDRLTIELVNVHTNLDDLGTYQGEQYASRKRHVLLAALTTYFIPELMSETVFAAEHTDGTDPRLAVHDDATMLARYAHRKGREHAAGVE